MYEIVHRWLLCAITPASRQYNVSNTLGQMPAGRRQRKHRQEEMCYA